jgi:hypothetical protein
MKQFSTPILFIFFNKSETTLRVFEQIQKLKPRNLYLLVDGARDSKPGEKEIRQQLLDSVLAGITWECDLKTFIREKNYGLRLNLRQGLDWFFEQVEEGIVLEDDCVPEQSFFPFCEEMLEKYRHDNRIMHISGSNFMPKSWKCADSYFFTRTPHVWGWASWRRAWKLYEPYVESYPEFEKGKHVAQFSKHAWVQKFWSSIFARSYSQELNSWAYPWTYSVWRNNGLCINPARNLIRNVGAATVGTTHTLQKDNELPTAQIEFPLKHPPLMLPSPYADAKSIELYKNESFLKVFLKNIKAKIT